ncbi:unnamed protein product, partial [Iphiclides podalirius]
MENLTDYCLLLLFLVAVNVSSLQNHNFLTSLPASDISSISVIEDSDTGNKGSRRVCSNSSYRSCDGSCNNLKNPSWGTPQTPYNYLVPNNYADGKHAWPKASDRGPLPNAREISLKVYVAKQEVETKWNLNTMQWGQIIAHDMSVGVDNLPGDVSAVCCDIDFQLAPDANTNPLCQPILVPVDDEFNIREGKRCLNLIRTKSSESKIDAPVPLSGVTAYMDLSLVYGSENRKCSSLRKGSGGRLLTSVFNNYDWPLREANQHICGGARCANEFAYTLGDIRANQSPQLTVLQIVLLLEHNRIADKLANLNPHWDDETIFQEARRICIAEIQYINYYEYLTILLGKNNMVHQRLIYPNARGYVNDYNSNVNPAVLNEHAIAAFRHFHTMIRGFLELIRENRRVAYIARLSDWFNRPSIIEIGDNFDNFIRGLSYQPADKSDEYCDPEITQNLFRDNHTSGEDLRALDIQRSRDHGVGTYVELRNFCGMSVPKTFSDLEGYITKENVKILRSLYKGPEDIDLVVGGSLEKHAPDALVGPTFLCILLKQFYNTRVGDRFFFENGADKSIAFTLPQLETIRHGASMARLLCDNGRNIQRMQPKAFALVSPENPLVRCSELPFVDLTLWKDSLEN